MGIIRPILFVSSGAGVIQGEGYVVKDFRPTVQDPTLEVKGLKPVPPVVVEVPVEEEADPKEPASPAIESASDSGKETSGKSRLGSGKEPTPDLNPSPPLVRSEGAASVVKVKTPSTPSMSDGKTKPPAAE